jgi:pimeloyl-ACP methyl ester carboxylesterase
MWMEPGSGFVETEDVRLHYVDWGGDGRPVVLLHATGFHARLWDPYAERLRGRLRVIALDQRGHGDSGLPRTGFAWEHLGEDLYAMIAALGIEGCDAAGHSSGGTAAAVCAATHPGSIDRLLLIDPVLRDGRGQGFPPGGPNPMAERTRRRRAVWESPHRFEEVMRSRPAFARWRSEYFSLYAHHGLRRRPDGHYELKCRPETEAQVYEGSARFNPWPALARLAVPVLLLRATLTESGRVPMPPDVADRIPNSRDLPVAATHFIPMEEPETVMAAMDGFLT